MRRNCLGVLAKYSSTKKKRFKLCKEAATENPEEITCLPANIKIALWFRLQFSHTLVVEETAKPKETVPVRKQHLRHAGYVMKNFENKSQLFSLSVELGTL